ncbi:LIMLP_12425 family protein [Leptospira idonii]|uniref:Uncharacterized protein n=1 Tax=Leptospira idonii TaxID=1193500 RepID=A0A4V3JY81_9LEPT|nr:hypothetical protein [Leptospira idonii]TGN20186.1 hypothetical protein EHS15_05715 [Leptospira idonii]
MNIRNWLRAQYPHLFPDEKESVVLESRLCNLFSEVRKKEDTIMPRMSNDFDTRLANLLQNEKLEPLSSPSYSALRNILENKRFQYSFSAAMLVSLVFVMVSRYSPGESNSLDSAGVVLDNTSYLNEPTSIDFSNRDQTKVLVDRLKNEPASIHGLKELEAYYSQTGRGNVAEEIHYLIEAAER